MNAIQFIKENGVEKARKVIDGAQSNAVYYWEIPRCTYGVYSTSERNQGRAIILNDLKRLVESVELVKEHYTLDRAIEYANSQYTAPEIKVCLLDAIANYKSIYSDNNMGDDSHIENHVSPLCKMGVK